MILQALYKIKNAETLSPTNRWGNIVFNVDQQLFLTNWNYPMLFYQDMTTDDVKKELVEMGVLMENSEHGQNLDDFMLVEVELSSPEGELAAIIAKTG